MCVAGGRIVSRETRENTEYHRRRLDCLNTPSIPFERGVKASIAAFRVEKRKQN